MINYNIYIIIEKNKNNKRKITEKFEAAKDL